MRTCWLGIHDWSKWVKYVEAGTATLGWPYAKEVQGRAVPYSENRQRRECMDCGLHQDRRIFN